MRHTTGLGVLAILLAGCGGDATPPTTLFQPGVSAARGSLAVSHASRSLRISGHCVLTFGAPPSPPPPVFEQEDVGSCVFSHLGNTTIVGVQEINFIAGTQSGERTFTAANGDILRAVHVGTSAAIGPGLRAFHATLTLVGGTGHFENATGTLAGTGVANLVTRTSTVSFEGEIRYDASDRSAQ
jgi:hypothetical protein